MDAAMMLRLAMFSVTWLALCVNGRAAPPVDFAHDVVPILKRHCVACHGGDKSEGGFSLNSRELILDAEAVVVGRSDVSRLVELIESREADEQMPPKDRPRLPPQEVATLRGWVDQGLRWEGGFSFAGARYEPPLRPRRPELPPPREGRDHPVDRILDAYLAAQSLPPPAPLDDAAFLRRLWLDVIDELKMPIATRKAPRARIPIVNAATCPVSGEPPNASSATGNSRVGAHSAA